MEETNGESGGLTVEEIIALEERGSIDGLRTWLGKVCDGFQRGEPAAGAHTRLFQRLAASARAKADPTESEEVEALIAQGHSLLAAETERQGVAERGAAFLAKFHEKLAAHWGDREPELRPLSFLDVRDLIALENEVYYWDSPTKDCRQWLAAGLCETVSNPDTAHLAFLPLQLIPGPSVPEQVGDAIALASGQEDLRRIGDCIPPTLLAMLHSEAMPAFGDYAVDAAAWRLAGCLGLEPGLLVPNARLYVMRAHVDEGFWRLAAPALFEAVHRGRPASASQSEFFAWLRREYKLHWTSELGRLLRLARAAEQRDQPNLELNTTESPASSAVAVEALGEGGGYLPPRFAKHRIDDFIPRTVVAA